MKKRILSLLIVFALLFCNVTAFAHDVPDMERTGSISVTMKMGETVVPGGALTVYRVGEIHEDDGNYDFQLTGDFVSSDVSLDDIQSPETAASLATYAKGNEISGIIKKVDDNGKAVFSELQLGLYLVVQNKAASGYKKAKPFLVSVPAVEDGLYVYDVDASPKVEVEKAPDPTPTPPRLPQTGQLNWPIPVLTVLGIALFIVGWALYRKKDAHEK